MSITDLVQGMAECNHTWMFKESSDEGEYYYCQKCLAEIRVERMVGETRAWEISAAVPIPKLRMKVNVIWNSE